MDAPDSKITHALNEGLIDILQKQIERLRAELAEAQNLAASRLEQMTSDRRQYLDVKQQRDELLSNLKDAAAEVKRELGSASDYEAVIARTEAALDKVKPS